MLCSQVPCLHFRQSNSSCKCSAAYICSPTTTAKRQAKAGTPDTWNRSILRAPRGKGVRSVSAGPSFSVSSHKKPMAESRRTAAIVVAAGRGLRAGSGGPKQYRSIGGQTVIFRAMEAFCSHPQVFAVQPVLNPDDTAAFNAAVSGLRYASPTAGGAAPQASVDAGLGGLASERPDIVLIHDAARPFVSEGVISRAIEAVARTGAAIPTVAVADTIKLVDANGAVESTPERARLRIAQTPQVFRFDV